MKNSKLLNNLAVADKVWKRKRALEGGIRLLPFACLALVAAVVVDLFFQLDAIPRLTILLVLAGVALFLLGRLVARAFFSSGDLQPIARRVENRDPEFGSKLINALQLEATAHDPEESDLTRELARRAIEEAGTSYGERDFRPFTASTTLRRSSLFAAVPLLAVLVLCFLFPAIAKLEGLRYFDPFGDHPPFSLTALEITTPANDDTKVVYGRPALVEVDVVGHRPKELFLTVTTENEEGDPVEIPLFPKGEKSFVQEIESVEGDLVIRAHNRSKRAISRERKIGVILNPEIEEAFATVIPPAYTKRKPTRTDLAKTRGKTPTIRALVGSTIEIEVLSNRPLSDGALGIRTSQPEEKRITLAAGMEDRDHRAAADFEAVESGRIRFDIRDVSGLTPREEFASNLVVTHDLAPRIQITEPAADGFIVENFEATVAFQATDDYGLRRMRIHTGINDTFSEPRGIDYSVEDPQKSALETLALVPARMGATAGDTLTVFADVTDNKPEPQTARTRTLTLEVITEEAYNEYLRLQTEIRDLENKYATFHDELRDLTEQQRELARTAEKAAADGVDQSERDELAARQSRLNRKLEKLAGRMENATRENPLYDLEKDLQKVLDEEASTIRDSIAQNREGLEQFLDSAPSSESNDRFAEEGDAQADRLDPAREAAEQQIAGAIEDAAKMQELLKAIAAYQKLYQIQEQLASQTKPLKEKVELDHEDKLSLRDMAAMERAVGEGLDAIVEKLRTGAADAEELYPAASEDARGIADSIERANLSSLADTASRSMLASRGAQSHQQAEHLRVEMEKLMRECGQCKGSGAGEFEQRLALMRSMAAGDTFSQMAKCQKFGLGQKPGMSMGQGSGMGLSGVMGMGGSTLQTQQQSLLGGESLLGQRTPRESVAKSDGSGTAESSEDVVRVGPGDGGDSGAKSSTRPSTALTGDLFTDEYQDLVDAYFKRLTSPETKP